MYSVVGRSLFSKILQQAFLTYLLTYLLANFVLDYAFLCVRCKMSYVASEQNEISCCKTDKGIKVLAFVFRL